MGGHRTIFVLVAIMTAVALVVGGVAIGVLYDTAFEERRADLIQIAQSQARLMEAVARFDRAYGQDYPGGAFSATVSQIVDAHERYEEFGGTGEFTLARREGDEIVFLLGHRLHALDGPRPVAFDSPLAEPMRRALTGMSGTMVGLDYGGVTVLAAYEPVAILDLGIVAKVDLAEVRAPFLRAGGIVFAIGFAIVAAGTALFLRVSNPMVRCMEESEARLSTTLRSVVGGVVTIDASGIIESLNPAAERMFGYSAEELVGRNVKVLMPEPDSGKHDGYIRHYLETGEARIVGRTREVTGRRKDGTALPLDLGVAEMRLGERRFFVGSLHEITERKRAEEALRESEEKFRTIVDNSPTKINIKDLEGRYLLVNKESAKLFGVTDQEARGKTIHEIFPEKKAADFARHDRAVIQTGQTIAKEEEWLGDNGVRTYLTVKFPIRDGEGRMTAVGAIGTDITERKAVEAVKARLEAQLRQAQKMEAVGTLAGGIAHDLNNTLVPVLGLVELTLEEVPADSLARANLEMVVAAAERSKDLVNQILAFSRQDKPERKPIKLCQVIKETLSFLRASLPSTIEIRQKLDETIGPVLADATEIHQILLNLGSNAGDAMGLKGGVLEVVLERAEVDERLASSGLNLKPGPHAKIIVRDTGSGMDENTCARIFDPFFTTKSVGEGTGMGLSVIHGIVESHDGAITVTSEPGRGASFEIYLPVSKRKEIDEPPMAKDVNPALAV